MGSGFSLWPVQTGGVEHSGLACRRGSGCSSVGRAVTSDTRGLRLESNHGQVFILNIYLLSTVFGRHKLRKRGQGMAHLKTGKTIPFLNVILSKSF